MVYEIIFCVIAEVFCGIACCVIYPDSKTYRDSLIRFDFVAAESEMICWSGNQRRLKKPGSEHKKFK